MDPFEIFFKGNFNFEKDNGIYRQLNFHGENFEKEYVAIRTKEGRLYDDEMAKNLPSIGSNHPLIKEWLIRGHSARMLAKTLKKERCKSILEIGCGNGWLTRYLHQELNIPACGVDVEMVELQQAARLSAGKDFYVLGDVFSDALLSIRADAIILASCIQYFSDLHKLIPLLLSKLNDNGSIHIIDSPFYTTETSNEAKKRSLSYFRSLNAEGMEKYYHHHEMEVMKVLGAKILYDPDTISNRIMRKFGDGSPFLWFRIKK